MCEFGCDVVGVSQSVPGSVLFVVVDLYIPADKAVIQVGGSAISAVGGSTISVSEQKIEY